MDIKKEREVSEKTKIQLYKKTDLPDHPKFEKRLF